MSAWLVVEAHRLVRRLGFPWKGRLAPARQRTNTPLRGLTRGVPYQLRTSDKLSVSFNSLFDAVMDLPTSAFAQNSASAPLFVGY